MSTVLKHARSVVEFIAGFAILLAGGAVAGSILGLVYMTLGHALLGDS